MVNTFWKILSMLFPGFKEIHLFLRTWFFKRFLESNRMPSPGRMKKPMENLSVKLFLNHLYHFDSTLPFCSVFCLELSFHSASFCYLFLSSFTTHIVCDTLPHHFKRFKKKLDPDSDYIMEKVQTFFILFQEGFDMGLVFFLDLEI